MKQKECVAMLLAGGQGSRLGVLTQKIAKPAVPYGGKYRIIDFPLSNCANSGITTVGILTQYQPLELADYVASGKHWDLDRLSGGGSDFGQNNLDSGSSNSKYRGAQGLDPQFIADLEKRTGLKIEKVEVGAIDFLKDAAIVKMYYRSNAANNSVDTTLKTPTDEYKLKE